MLADLHERQRVAPEVVGRTVDEVLGVFTSPWVVGRHVVGHQVEDQPYPAGSERGARRGQAGVAAQSVVDRIAADAVRGTDDVVVDQVG